MSNLPINLPMRVVSGQPVSATWANSIREAIARLATRKDVKKRGGVSGAGGLDPWQPTFFTTGTEPSLVYKCNFNLGTINDVPATNWNDDFTLSMAEDEYHFVVVTVASSSGQVSGLTLSVETTAPATDSIASGTPPVEHKIVLGAIGRTSAKMIETTNLSMTAAVVFLESKASPATGAEPFDRWWRWNHATI